MTVSTPTTSGQVLTSAYVNNNINSGLVWISTTTIGSTVTSVAVAGCFSSTYDNYRILISGGIASTTADFQMILGSTVTGYVYASVYNTFTTGTPSGLQATNDPAWRYIGGGTANTLQMETELQSPNLAKYTVLTSRMVSTVATGLNMTTNGYLPNTTQYTGMTVSPTAGTWTGGSITVYGYRKP